MAKSSKGGKGSKGGKRTPTKQLHGAALAKRLASEAKLGKVAGRGKGAGTAKKISSEYDELVKHMKEDKIIPDEGDGYISLTPNVAGFFTPTYSAKVRRTYKQTFKAESLNKEIAKARDAAQSAAEKALIASKARESLRRRLTSYFGPDTANRMIKEEDIKAKERAAKATTTQASSEGGR